VTSLEEISRCLPAETEGRYACPVSEKKHEPQTSNYSVKQLFSKPRGLLQCDEQKFLFKQKPNDHHLKFSSNVSRTTPQAICRLSLSPRRPVFDPAPVHVEIVADKLAVKFLSQYLGFRLSASFHRSLTLVHPNIA
jgi:hypothetical protein